MWALSDARVGQKVRVRVDVFPQDSWEGELTTINPEVERFGYQRAGLKTVEIDSSHVVMLAHPKRVADVIREAVAAAGA